MSMCLNRQSSEKGGPVLTECDNSEDAVRSSFHKSKAAIILLKYANHEAFTYGAKQIFERTQYSK
jgi:hypothetical protein